MLITMRVITENIIVMAVIKVLIKVINDDDKYNKYNKSNNDNCEK